MNIINKNILNRIITEKVKNNYMNYSGNILLILASTYFSYVFTYIIKSSQVLSTMNYNTGDFIGIVTFVVCIIYCIRLYIQHIFLNNDMNYILIYPILPKEILKGILKKLYITQMLIMIILYAPLFLIIDSEVSIIKLGFLLVCIMIVDSFILLLLLYIVKSVPNKVTDTILIIICYSWLYITVVLIVGLVYSKHICFYYSMILSIFKNENFFIFFILIIICLISLKILLNTFTKGYEALFYKVYLGCSNRYLADKKYKKNIS